MNGYKKYTDNQIQEFISPFGLILDNYETVKSIYAHDDIGYKYHFTLSNIKMGRTPSWLQNNPFALENVRLYLKINAPYYELLDDKYISCKTKMRFICHKHEDKGIQYNSVDNIIHNHHVCKYCGYQHLSEVKQISKEQVIQLCKEKNVEYIDQYLKNGETYIQYQCIQHKSDGIQEMSLDHFRASLVPCRFCQITQGEFKVKTFLDKYHILYNFQHTFPDCKNIYVLKFDFYLPEYQIAIEYDGKQHYEPFNYFDTEEENIKAFKDGQYRDRLKDEYCKNNSIHMIRIPYWDFNHIEQILRKELIDI